ncbi:hypothetical protein ACJRO7_011497 [Eucalyptus globulus]|uniref:Uncharacterized protein n=1 Tax=Eucalyptus globulus TaxID=34317 RepID=A0ABD3LIR5_EUCGL
MSRFEFHSPTISMDDLSDTSFSVALSLPPGAIQASLLQDDNFLPVLPVEQNSLHLTVINSSLLDNCCQSESNSSSQFTEEDDSWTLNLTSVISSEPTLSTISAEASIILPSQDMEVDDQLSIFHPLKAYGEAREAKQQVLVGEISRQLREKCSPMSTTLEHVAYYLIKASDDEGDYLRRFMKNLEELIRQGKKAVRLTSLRWMEEDCSYASAPERLGGINRWMTEHAQSLGLRLKMEETNIQELVAQLNKSRGREWLAFNCMPGFPHMRKRRNVINHATEFLKATKSSIGRSDRGIRTVERNGYGAFLEGKLVDLQALFESMELHFPGPDQLTEARMALECLFMGPYVSSLTTYQNWEESGETSRVVVSEMGLEARRISRREHHLVEAKELVKLGGGESPYWVRFEGAEDNRMALGYRGSTC